MSTPVIEIAGLKNQFGTQWVHTDINLTINKGEILGLIGGSGCGKTTLLRCILMLLKPTAGSIRVFGHELQTLNEEEASILCQRWGILFQRSALFSSLTVLENVLFPIKKQTELELEFSQELALLKLNLTGLSPDAAYKYPSELSGGMQRRAATARAIALDPELLFLDEPTSGLDPISAKSFDKLIVFLRDTLHLTVVIVSHDIASLERTTDRVAFIGDGKILDVAPLSQLRHNQHPLIADYFSKI